jgi:hypothetical protein
MLFICTAWWWRWWRWRRRLDMHVSTTKSDLVKNLGISHYEIPLIHPIVWTVPSFWIWRLVVRFGRTCHFYLLGLRVSQATNKQIQIICFEHLLRPLAHGTLFMVSFSTLTWVFVCRNVHVTEIAVEILEVRHVQCLTKLVSQKLNSY